MKNALLCVSLVCSLSIYGMENNSLSALSVNMAALTVTPGSPADEQYDCFFKEFDNGACDQNNPLLVTRLEEIAKQTGNPRAAIRAKERMAYILLNRGGIKENDILIKAKNLLEEVAEQKDDMLAAASAWCNLAEWHHSFGVDRASFITMRFHYLKRAALQTQNRPAQERAIGDLHIKAMVQMKKSNPINGLPSAVAIISDQVYAYIIDENDHNIYVRNVESNKNMWRISDSSRLLKNPKNLTIEPGSTIAIVTNEDGSHVNIDLVKNMVIAR